MERYYYDLAGCHVQLEVPFPLIITAESRSFLFSGCAPTTPNHRIVLIPRNALAPLPRQGFQVQENYYTRLDGKDAVYHSLFPGEPPVVLVKEEGGGQTVCYYLPQGEPWVKETAGLLNLLELDNLLLCMDRLILHASFVLWQGKGILFSAPSGTGKSTQAALWEKHQAARIVNGDRAGLSRQEGRWLAHGLPFAGSSRIFCRESAPIGVVVCLSQGRENTLRRLSPLEAMRRLLPEVNMRRWDEDSVDKATRLLTELVMEVPVYHLSCRPDKEATVLLRELLEK